MTKSITATMALAVAAMALPVIAADSTQEQMQKNTASENRDVGTVTKKTPEQIAKEKAAKDKARAEATKAPMTRQDQVIENTNKEGARSPGPVKKMTPEEKAADKKAKRVPPTPEEQEKQRKASPG
jgi:hypothetical protein